MIGVSVQVKPLSTKPEVKRIVRAPFVSKVLPMGAVDKDGRCVVGGVTDTGVCGGRSH